MQGPNGRLMLFVPVRESRQLDSWLLVCSGLHSVPRQEKAKGLCVKNELANKPGANHFELGFDRGMET